MPRSFQLQTVLASALLGATLLHAGPGHASPSYPEVLQSAIGLECAPRCTLCHEDREGGTGTIRTSTFGETLVNVVELGEDDESTLRCAMQLLDPSCELPPACAGPDQECFATDTDGDGVGDIAELRDTRDPNVDGEGLLCGATYGCGAELAPRGTASWVAGLTGILMAAMISRWRRRFAAAAPRRRSPNRG